jgi:hypothetical protein
MVVGKPEAMVSRGGNLTHNGNVRILTKTSLEKIMKKVATSLMMSACLLIAPAAWASWGSFVSTGNATGIGNPSCAPVSTGHVACAVRSSKSVIMVNEFNGSTWGAWKSLAGTVSSDPSCTSDGNGKVYCAATATNGDLQVTVLSGGAWSNPSLVNAALFSAPSCAKYITGQVLCTARNGAGGLVWSLYNGTAWSAFANLTASTVSAPSCTSDDVGGVICAVFTTGFTTLVNRFTGGAWEAFLNIGGIAGGEPDCSFWKATGEVVCFAKSYTSGIYVSIFNGGSWVTGNWSSYSYLGGDVNDNAGCTTQAAGQLVCGAIGIGTFGNALYANVYNGSNWSGWTKIGGVGVGSPACTALDTGQAVCLLMGINNKLTSVVGP